MYLRIHNFLYRLSLWRFLSLMFATKIILAIALALILELFWDLPKEPTLTLQEALSESIVTIIIFPLLEEIDLRVLGTKRAELSKSI